MADENVKKLLREVRESLERSQRMLESLEGRQQRRSSPPPPPPAPTEAPSSPAKISYARRKTAAYDTAYLTGEPEPRWESGERPATRTPIPSSAPPPVQSSAEQTPKATPESPQAPRKTGSDPAPPPVSQGRYTIIAERNARKPR